jgi:glucosamine--fructose-6-phosphate aminotransferase (isomerizing)
LATVAFLSAVLDGQAEALGALAQVPEAMSQTLGMNEAIAQAAPRYRYMEGCVVIGRGYNYATAFEMALKMKELTYTIVQPYSSADFLHGPMALIEPGFPVFIIAPSGAMQSELQPFMETLRERRAELVVISDVPESLALARVPLALPCSVPEWLSPLVAILPGQLFSLHLADTRDLDVDAPRGITKVTETI